MPENIRALIVVLLAAIPAFYLTKRAFASVITGGEFKTWRNAWYAAAITAFLSYNFFVFAAVTVCIAIYAYRTPAAIIAAYFILLLATPLFDATVSLSGMIQSLITLNDERILAITLLLPLVFISARSGRLRSRSMRIPDRLILIFGILVIALEFRRADLTSVMRAAVHFSLDAWVPYFAISRSVANVSDVKKVLAGFVIAVVPMSLIAIVATVKGWPIYNSVLVNWGGIGSFATREGVLRGSASAGPIVSGYLFMIGLGCLIPFGTIIVAPRRHILFIRAILTAALTATLSRGPWVGTAVLFIVWVLTGARPVPKLIKYSTLAILGAFPLLLLPGGQRLLEFLPFIGSVDTGNIDYRSRVFQNSVEVIARNFWFGSADYLSTPEMQELKQGQGIVDIVNTYLHIGLGTGVVGLGLFLGFFSMILIGLWRIVRRPNAAFPELRTYAATCFAILAGILVTIGTVSSVEFIPYLYWSFAGLCVALIRIVDRERLVFRSSPVRTASARRTTFGTVTTEPVER